MKPTKKRKTLTDKQRIDWLSKQGAMYDTTNGYDFEKDGFFKGSLRKAIDAAIKASRTTKRKKGELDG